jgi:hypothetical protein
MALRATRMNESSENHTPQLEPRSAEVHQQAQGKPARAQVVQSLPHVSLGETGRHLQFDNDAAADNQVRHVNTHTPVSPVNDKGLLDFQRNSGEPKLFDHRIPIDGLKKAVAESVRDGEAGADDLFSQGFELRIKGRSHNVHP